MAKVFREKTFQDRIREATKRLDPVDDQGFTIFKDPFGEQISVGPLNLDIDDETDEQKFIPFWPYHPVLSLTVDAQIQPTLIGQNKGKDGDLSLWQENRGVVELQVYGGLNLDERPPNRYWNRGIFASASKERDGTRILLLQPTTNYPLSTNVYRCVEYAVYGPNRREFGNVPLEDLINRFNQDGTFQAETITLGRGGFPESDLKNPAPFAYKLIELRKSGIGKETHRREILSG
ncbi:hypothetical protein HYV84_04415 [Candidatus Woesearchaeota archaeon]|nr:hypothetical protein [Candidatus Woesearchaeota archaeon]